MCAYRILFLSKPSVDFLLFDLDGPNRLYPPPLELADTCACQENGEYWFRSLARNLWSYNLAKGGAERRGEKASSFETFVDPPLHTDVMSPWLYDTYITSTVIRGCRRYAFPFLLWSSVFMSEQMFLLWKHVIISICYTNIYLINVLIVSGIFVRYFSAHPVYTACSLTHCSQLQSCVLWLKNWNYFVSRRRLL